MTTHPQSVFKKVPRHWQTVSWYLDMTISALTHSVTHSLTHSHSHSHSLSLSLSLSLTLTHSLSLTLTLTHSHSLSLSLPLTLTHSLSLSLTHSHSLSLTLTHSHSLSLTLTHSHSLSLTLTHSHSLSLTLTHSLTHPPTHSLTHSHSLSLFMLVRTKNTIWYRVRKGDGPKPVEGTRLQGMNIQHPWYVPGVFIVGCRSQLSAWSQDLHRHLFDLPKAILYRWTVVVLMGLCGQMHQNIVIKSVILKIRDKAIARC